MYYKLRDVIIQYIRSHFGYYLLAISFFFVGIIIGAVVVKALPDFQVQELRDYLNYYFVDFNTASLSQELILRDSITNNLRYIFMIWLLGATIIGFPFILILLFLRGFILGFTVGFLVDQIAFKGVLFAVVSILPHNIIIIPGILIAGVTGLCYSLNIIKLRIRRKRYNLSQLFFNYSTVILITGIVIMAGGLIEAYITPVFMRFIIPIIK